MKLEIGKRYVTRDGKITSSLTDGGHHLYCFKGKLNHREFSWMRDGTFVEGEENHPTDLVSEYFTTGETTNEVVAESGRHYVAEGNQVWEVEADGTRVLVFDSHGAAPDRYDEIGAQIARNQRLDIAATLGAGLLGKLNYVINTARHDLFANDALALADALIEASKTPPTP